MPKEASISQGRQHRESKEEAAVLESWRMIFMEKTLQGKIISFMEEYHMVEEGDHILAAVSGGADSLCMLMVLLAARQEKGYRLSVVHVEHGIRGEESWQDAAFVESFCRDRGIPARIYHCQAAEYAKAHKMTLEEGARQLRYGFFGQAAAGFGANKIAVAHNRNDCAETMLFHLARGSGLRGLKGISPVRGEVIRPLLCVGRKEIEAYLREMGQGYCHDKTNEEVEYARNRIRHQVLPALEEVNSQAVAHMGQAAFAVAEALELLEGLVQGSEGKYVREQGQGVFISQEVLEEKAFLRTSLLHKAVSKVSGSSRDIAEIHVKQLSGLLEKQVGRKLSLPYGIQAERTYGGIRLEKRQRQGIPSQEGTGKREGAFGNGGWMLPPEGMLEIPCFGYRICTKIIEKMPKFGEIPKKMYTKWLDYDKIKGIMRLRTRQAKDFFIISADGKKKKLKNYLIDEKIPRQERDSILLLADDVHILWAIGWRISEDVKVTEHTKRVLEIQVQHY